MQESQDKPQAATKIN